MNIRDISLLDWEQKWFAPSFSFISCSYFGRQYYHVCRERWGRGLPHVVFIARGQRLPQTKSPGVVGTQGAWESLPIALPLLPRKGE